MLNHFHHAGSSDDVQAAVGEQESGVGGVVGTLHRLPVHAVELMIEQRQSPQGWQLELVQIQQRCPDLVEAGSRFVRRAKRRNKAERLERRAARYPRLYGAGR